MILDPKTLQIILAIAFAVLGIVIVIFGVRVLKSLEMTKRLDEFVANQDKVFEPDIATKSRIIISREYSGSLFSRTILPGVKKVVSFLGQFTPENAIQQMDHQLTIAKNPYNLTARNFYGIRIFLLLLGICLAVFLNYRNANLNLMSILGGFLIILLFLIGPVVWLRSRMRKVQEDVRRGMPDVLDMLSVCTTAGLGFDQAMQKVAEYWQTTVGMEFRRVVQEMEMGVTRADALRNMAARTDVTELSSFVAVIIQAETLGMQMANVLHGQADQMRILRQLRAKEIANRLPAKMIVPLAVLILPALLAVILGPIVPSIVDLFTSF